MTWISRFLLETWDILLDASPYILLGLLVAGLLKTFLRDELVRRHLGQGKVASVFKAALLGVPLPLCSCGVLPVARELRKQGATKGATTAFLISTPESGVDSISVTWALMDPIMTIARPLAAMVTAVVAGLLSNLVDHNGGQAEEGLWNSLQTGECVCGDSCTGMSDDHGNAQNCGGGCYSNSGGKAALRKRLVQGITYAFTELWGDIGTWFFGGVILSGLIGILIPAGVLGSFFGGGLTSMLLMLMAGIPIYICATASTPIAAALILKGVSPGAALVFLLAGPATNMASLSVLLKVLGKKTVTVYLLSISIMAIAFGLGVDALYSNLGISAEAVLGTAGKLLPMPVRIASVGILALLTIRSLLARHRHHDH